MTRKLPLKIKQKFNSIIHNAATGGILLIVSTIIALIWANFAAPHSYHDFWYKTLIKVGEPGQFFYNVSIHHFVNDFLMAIFFFITGLEIKREIQAGELSSAKKAMIPIAAALGGMIVPALIFFFFNSGLQSASGWGVPMATDIAFSLGILALLGKKVPLSLKIFLTALAIADDLGAVLVIAFFYTDQIVVSEIVTAILGVSLLFIANYIGIRNRTFYYVIGTFIVWVSFVYSGVHATLAGILVAFTVPSTTKIDTKTYIAKSEKLIEKFKKLIQLDNKGIISNEKMNILIEQKNLILDAYNPLQYKEKFWHPFVAFFIIPVFALANAGVELNKGIAEIIVEPIFLGIFFGLVFGKLFGVFLFTKLAQILKLGELPSDIKNIHIIGIGLLAAVGFTMSLFIANLAFFSANEIELAKQAILLTSIFAGIAGYFVLLWSTKLKQ